MAATIDSAAQDTTPTLAGFVRHFAHELGNPVASIRMSAEMLQGDYPSEMHDELFQIIMSETLRLESLIETAVYFASIGEPKRSEVDLASSIEAAIRQQEIRIPVTVQLDPTHTTISADGIQFSRALCEILSNGAESGATRLQITTRREDDSLFLTITDDGEGILSGKNDVVDALFYTTREGKLGLGLSIAKRIIELHHGSIAITGATPTGTAVTVRLPQLNNSYGPHSGS